MKTHIYYFIIIAILISGCNTKENPFEIDITTTGYDDSTLIYLTDVETDVVIDSGYIINNKLVFSVELEKPTHLILLTDYKIKADFEYKFLWKDSHRMSIKAEKGDLRNAIINGSELQSQVDLLNSSKAHLQVKLDSLQNEINTTNPENEEKINSLNIEQKEILNEMTAIDIKYIKQHPDHLNSIIVLVSVAKQISKKQTIELFENINPELQSTKYGEVVENYLALRKNIGIGLPAVDFLMSDLKGDVVQLANFEDKYILLDFWASWCAPCRKENPILLMNYKKYKGKGFEIISVNLDKKRNDWEKAVEKDGIIWTNVSGHENDVISIYNIQSLPKNYLINPDGVIVAEDLIGGQLEAKLKEIYSY